MQWLAQVCVRRPVFAGVLMLVIFVLGGVGYTRLGLDQFPNIDLPFVLVTTTLEGAAPEEVEIRFLRFALQANTPGFLGYKDHMEEDKALLLKRLPEVKDDNLKQLMLPFLLNSEYLTETEKQSLSDIKAN